MSHDMISEHDQTSEAQILGMISLLTDSSSEVIETCQQALIAQGEHARALVQERLAVVEGHHARRLRAILAAIRFPEAEAECIAYLSGTPSLETGALLIARLVDGGPEPDQLAAQLDAMAAAVRARLDVAEPGAEEAEIMMAALGHVLVERFPPGNEPPSRAVPVDALLHGAATGRGGLPLPLCMTWILVARRTGIPLVGVNTPGHFLMRLDLPGQELVFDAPSGGRVIPRTTWEQMLARFGMQRSTLDELSCSDEEMLLRTLRNLINLADPEIDGGLGERAMRVLEAAMERQQD
ncbi:MAG: regulator of sirC expression with transglutaminase-like and TPR domain [Pseudohongiellaceae bacterium]|jgi:regulator of sirC expression with transglutaminase-like and TPR domain